MAKQIKPIRLTMISDCGDFYDAIHCGSDHSILIGENEFAATSVSRAGNSVKADFVQVSRRAPTWTGEGLPPAGTVCEVLNRGLHNPVWEKCTILFCGKHRMLYDSESCSERCGYIEDLEFRPIRTPEQIAAEERKAEIDAMYQIFSEAPGLASQEGIAALYDTGYRKFEIVDE